MSITVVKSEVQWHLMKTSEHQLNAKSESRIQCNSTKYSQGKINEKDKSGSCWLFQYDPNINTSKRST